MSIERRRARFDAFSRWLNRQLKGAGPRSATYDVVLAARLTRLEFLHGQRR